MSRLAAVSTLVILISGFAFAQPVPPLLNYQGQLTDAAGNPLATGAYDVTFNVFNDPTLSDPSTNLVWGPQTINVQVVNGYFNVVLGNDDGGDPITDAFETIDRYFQLEVDGGGPILPRQQVLTTPYSSRADFGGGEVGDVVASMLSETDFYALRGANKWVACDGRSVAGSRYSQLTGRSNAPDLRGRVPLGVDGSADRVADAAAQTVGEASGQSVVALTLGTLPTHHHEVASAYHPTNTYLAGGVRNGGSLFSAGNVGSGGFGAVYETEGTLTTANGTGSSHYNMQPYLTVTYFCRVN